MIKYTYNLLFENKNKTDGIEKIFIKEAIP